MLNKEKGFTLVELIVVIVVLGILAAIGIPRYNNYVNESRLAHIKADMKTISSLIEVIAMDDDGIYRGGGNDGAELRLAITEGRAYKEGNPLLSEDDIGGGLHLIKDSFIRKDARSKLKGTFLVDKNDEVYYIANKKLKGENTPNEPGNNNDNGNGDCPAIYFGKMKPIALNSVGDIQLGDHADVLKQIFPDKESVTHIEFIATYNDLARTNYELYLYENQDNNKTYYLFYENAWDYDYYNIFSSINDIMDNDSALELRLDKEEIDLSYGDMSLFPKYAQDSDKNGDAVDCPRLLIDKDCPVIDMGNMVPVDLSQGPMVEIPLDMSPWYNDETSIAPTEFLSKHHSYNVGHVYLYKNTNDGKMYYLFEDTVSSEQIELYIFPTSDLFTFHNDYAHHLKNSSAYAAVKDGVIDQVYGDESLIPKIKQNGNQYGMLTDCPKPLYNNIDLLDYGHFEFILAGEVSQINGASTTVPNGEVHLSGFKEGESWRQIAIIPSTVTLNKSTYSVTAISDMAFVTGYFDRKHKSHRLGILDIPGSIKDIGEYSFHRNKIFNLKLKEGLVNIYDGAFSGDGNYSERNLFKNLTIPSTLRFMGDNAFAYNGLESLDIPQTLTSLGEGVFRNNNLTSVVIPDHMETVPDGTFLQNNITSITFSPNTKHIGRHAFSWNNLASPFLTDNIETIGESAFADNQINELIIPSSVTIIQREAFKGNELGSLIIPETVDVLGERAFAQSGLTSVDILSSSTEVGKYCFESNKLTSLGLPEGTTIIRDSTFRNNLLTSVVLPNSVKTIESRAFYENKLKSLIVPSSTETIMNAAFSKNELTSITLSNGIKNIMDSAFAYNQLKSITLPQSLLAVGSGGFSWNGPWSKIDIKGNIYSQSDIDRYGSIMINGSAWTYTHGIQMGGVFSNSKQ